MRCGLRPSRRSDGGGRTGGGRSCVVGVAWRCASWEGGLGRCRAATARERCLRWGARPVQRRDSRIGSSGFQEVVWAVNCVLMAPDEPMASGYRHRGPRNSSPAPDRLQAMHVILNTPSD